jgi:hypothetical protein
MEPLLPTRSVGLGVLSSEIVLDKEFWRDQGDYRLFMMPLLLKVKHALLLFMPLWPLEYQESLLKLIHRTWRWLCDQTPLIKAQGVLSTVRLVIC